MQPRIRIKHTMEKLASHSGLILIGELMNFMQLKKRLNNLDSVYCTTPTFTHSGEVFSMMGLLSIGKPDFDAIEIFRSKQDFFRKELNTSGGPSSPTIRQRIDLIGQARKGAGDLLGEGLLSQFHIIDTRRPQIHIWTMRTYQMITFRKIS